MAKSGTPINRVLVFGASGHVGAHLVPLLAARGLTVRAVARRSPVIEACGRPGVELVQADTLAPDTVGPALDGIDVAYYLVHSMAAVRDLPRLGPRGRGELPRRRRTRRAERSRRAAGGAGGGIMNPDRGKGIPPRQPHGTTPL